MLRLPEHWQHSRPGRAPDAQQALHGAPVALRNGRLAVPAEVHVLEAPRHAWVGLLDPLQDLQQGMPEARQLSSMGENRERRAGKVEARRGRRCGHAPHAACWRVGQAAREERSKARLRCLEEEARLGPPQAQLIPPLAPGQVLAGEARRDHVDAPQRPARTHGKQGGGVLGKGSGWRSGGPDLKEGQSAPQEMPKQQA